MIRRFALYLLLAQISCAALAAPSADEVLAKSDEVRNPQIDYTIDVKIVSNKPGKTPQTSTFEVKVKGKDKTVVRTITPVVDRGRILLMSENNFWAFLPRVSKPLRISLQERLTGDVANGDLARANFTGDYTPSIKGTETIEKTNYTILDLKAKREDVTYGRVVLWVENGTNKPSKAEFYAFSGRLLKTCTYENYAKVHDRQRPTRITMRDAIAKDQYSVLDYSNVKVAPLPEKFFTKDYMKKFADE